MPHATQHADVATAQLDSALRGGPFHVALRAAIAARGLPLQRVQHHLSRHGVKVGVTSLSYWQQGARRPQRPESLRAVRALEEILQLPEESLIRLLSEADAETSERRPAGRSYRAHLAASGVLDRLLAELGCPAPDGGVHTLGHHERIRIGAGRELAGRESHLIVRAHRDGVDRFLAVHHGDPGCVPARMSVHALENCRTGRVRTHDETGVLVTELLFDTRLRAGDTHLFRYGVEDGTAGVSREYVRGFGTAGGQYALQVRFDVAALPVRCHRFTQHSPAAPRGGRQELALSGRHHSVHLVEPRVRSGMLGIGWDWE
ncbi:XRE family transcriptional regulator OS=Streptomyces tendae OX=1932 GN=GUR47_12760 PE=4 SV=1 [Streptomyces tendae]